MPIRARAQGDWATQRSEEADEHPRTSHRLVVLVEGVAPAPDVVEVVRDAPLGRVGGAPSATSQPWPVPGW